jgi:hypothetical protein
LILGPSFEEREMKNPVALDEAVKKMNECASEQGGTNVEGTSSDPHKGAGAAPEFSRSGDE